MTRFWWNCSRWVNTLETMDTPIEPPVLRAALIIADAWSVFDGGMPSKDAAMIGTKISGNPTPSSMRNRAMYQKPRSAYTLVMPHIESAMIIAPATIRYFGCTLADTRPTTNIITMVTTPPGESTRPAQVAV